MQVAKGNQLSGHAFFGQNMTRLWKIRCKTVKRGTVQCDNLELSQKFDK
jgi:uncharacterized 2Fe-2S/4Fe-4S cluster protein (DUF4445 family)